MKTLQWILLATLSMSLVVGCSKSGAGSTPKETVKNFRDAMLDYDAETMAACIDTNSDTKEAVSTLCEAVVAMMSFSEKMTAEYGKDAMGKSGGKNPLDELKSDKWLDQLKVKENGDKATVTPTKGEQFNMVKKDGKWYLDAGMITPGKTSAKEMEKAVKAAKMMTDAFNKCAKNIGKDGYTAQKIQQDLMKEFFGAAMKANK